MKRRSSHSSFHFPLGVDPLRILLAARDHWKLIAATTLVLGLAGGGIAFRLFNKTFTVSTTLTRIDGNSMPNQDLQPRRLAETTLVGQSKTPQVIENAVLLLDQRYSAGAVRGMTSASYDRNSRIFQFNATSHRNASEAFQVLDAWVEAAIKDGRELQRREAEVLLQRWRTSLQALEPELEMLESEIAEFVQEQEIFDSNVQLQEFLQAIHSVERAKAENEVNLEAKRIQLSHYLDPDHLALQLPVRQRLEQAHDDLEELRTDYRDIHPEIIKQLGRIQNLETQFAVEFESIRELAAQLLARVDQGLDDESVKKDLMLFAVARLGTEAAQEVNRVIEEIRSLQLKVREQITALDAKRVELNTMPRKTADLAKLKRREQELSDTYDALQDRIQAASLLSKNPPGYLEVMNEGSPDQYRVSTGQVKIAAVSAVSTLGGFFLGLLLASIAELRRKDMRTPLQAAIATRTFPRLCLLHGDDDEDESNAREFWLAHMARPGARGRRILFPIIGELKSEYRFWQSILENVRRDNAKALFIDVAQQPLSPAFRNVLLDSLPDESRQPHSRFAADPDFAGSRAPDPDEPIIIPPRPAESDLANDLEDLHGARQLVPRRASTHALSEPDQQYLLPRENGSGYAARYLSAANITVEELSDILEEVPSQYYVLCRWTIGPSASLASLGKNFDQYYLVNCPSTSTSRVAASHSRIYRKMLNEPDGLVVIDQANRSRLLRCIQWLERKFFELKREPQSSAPPSEEDEVLL
ncbi:MAG TPA: hypothetical protein VMN36_05005 [Verrucomicrobiales bacterium]|nr:hypothetical protein [Verrucomicrobiales bacterium]